MVRMRMKKVKMKNHENKYKPHEGRDLLLNSLMTLESKHTIWHTVETLKNWLKKHEGIIITNIIMVGTRWCIKTPWEKDSNPSFRLSSFFLLCISFPVCVTRCFFSSFLF